MIFQASALISLAYTAFKIAPFPVHRCVSILFNFIWLQSLDGSYPLCVVNYYFLKRQISLKFSPFIPPNDRFSRNYAKNHHRTLHSFSFQSLNVVITLVQFFVEQYTHAKWILVLRVSKLNTISWERIAFLFIRIDSTFGIKCNYMCIYICIHIGITIIAFAMPILN